MKNLEIAKLFEKIADALEVKGENSFRVNSYRKMSRILEEFTGNLENLDTVSGIGEGTAKKIKEYLETGDMSFYHEVMQDIPAGLLDLLQINSLGPKTLGLAYRELGVRNLDDLEKVIADGRLASLPRMGEKRVENIKHGIELFLRSRQRISLAVAFNLAHEIVSFLEEMPQVRKITPAGSFRRRKETIGDLDLLAVAKDGSSVIDYFTKLPIVKEVLARGETKGSVLTKDDVQVDLRVVDESAYGSALHYFTGSKEHNIKIREMARLRGLKVNEYGIFRGTEKIASTTEEEVYQALGLPWISPELREDRGEIEAALRGELPHLITLDDIKGDLHVHSSYSDGQSSIEEMTLAAKNLGYEYLAITDHSASAFYAHGLTIDRLLKQQAEIEDVRQKVSGIHLLSGTEADIRGDGELDYPDEFLAKFDFVVASVHSGFKKNVTARMIKAMENPYVDVIAHPTGRLISSRDGYDIDLEAVMGAAVRTGTFLEINSYFDRLDLNDVYSRKAAEMGIKLAINSDAHNTAMLNNIGLGVFVARRAWLTKNNVINTYSLDKLLKMRKRESRNISSS